MKRWRKFGSKSARLLTRSFVLFCSAAATASWTRPRRRRPSVRWKMETRVRARLRERVCLSVSPLNAAAAVGRGTGSLSLHLFVAWHDVLDHSYYEWIHLISQLTGTPQYEIICYFCCRHREGGLTCGRPSWREGELPESRANGRRQARSPSSSARRTDRRTAGGRACDTTNNVRFARATGGIDGGEEERGKTSAAAAIPSARSLASNTTVDLGCKACRQ